MGNDAATMAYALEVMPTLPQPFLMQILTVSTHYPFRAKVATDFHSGDIAGTGRDHCT